MKRVHGKLRIILVLLGLGMVASLGVLLSGCWLLNTLPEAKFTASATSGTAPLTVNFSAILSRDADGILVKFEWDFGDGTSGSGESASHTYAAAGSFTVVLRVTDDKGATDTAERTISVTAAEEPGGAGAGPTASFTATPLFGNAPLTVTFNASASVYPGHTINFYQWTYGDGTTGTGMTPTHTYSPTVTTTYRVVLRIIASDNTEGTTTRDITVTVTPAAPSTVRPTASFTANPETALVPATITFNPAGSSAAAGLSIAILQWSFGDGSYHTTYNVNQTVSHTYYTAQASQNFTASLIVIDNDTPANTSTTASQTVTVKDWQPVAGFEQKKLADAWGVARVANITINGVGDAVQTVSLRSVAPTNWTVAPLPKAEGTEPANFEDNGAIYADGDRNLSYDREGQSLGNGWGLTTYLWNFDGGTPIAPGQTTMAAQAAGSCQEFQATFQLAPAENSRTFNITLTVVDIQGAQNSITRKVTLNRFP